MLTFDNTNFVIRSEQALLAENLHIAVMPVPAQIHAGCGLCLRVGGSEIAKALQILADQRICEPELYTRIADGSAYLYNKITDRSMLWNRS